MASRDTLSMWGGGGSGYNTESLMWTIQGVLEKTEGTIKNGQSSEIVFIGYIRHRTKTNKAEKAHYRKLKR